MNGYLVFIAILTVIVSGGEVLFFDQSGPEGRESPMSNRRFKKVIALGIDGLDPKIVTELMNSDQLPNFSKVYAEGSFLSLATTNPPQSPVAWSSIATGANPGVHGLFDFIIRRPKQYLPDLSMVAANTRNILGLKESMFLPVRKGTPFWKVTSEKGIPTDVIRWPVTFPPEEVSGHMLSGMGVVDLKGNLGRYALYTTGRVAAYDEGEGNVIRVVAEGEKIETVIRGPMVSKVISKKEAEVPLTIELKPTHSSVLLNVDGVTAEVKEGMWSKWLRIKFNVGMFKEVAGICHFYLIRLSPDVELYLSPIEVDPKDPCFIISYPEGYSDELAEEIGEYHTLGMPEDTKGVTENRFDEQAFLDMCDGIMMEREKMLTYELNHFHEGLLAFVFDTTDRIQHIFWRSTDPQHPLYDPAFAEKYCDVIKGYYRRMDRILGQVLDHVDKDTALMVFSDHGFTSFRCAVHVNRWLVQNGFMKLEPGHKEGGALFEHVDWENTRAYSVGFGSIYLNLKGREGRGIVSPGDEARRLKEGIRDRLLQIWDPKTGERILREVYFGEEIYRGPYAENAPDLVVGFRPGYRASWQTAIGETPPQEVLEDNLKKWSGDHLVDPYYVPGILLTNFRVQDPHPHLIDIAPTILKCFDISKPGEMEGNALF